MNSWFIIPALLGMAVTLSMWTALQLIFWARAPQNFAGAFLLLAMACALVGYLYQLVFDNQATMLFWERFQVVGLNLVYPAWLLFVMYFTGNGKRVTPLLVAILGGLSAIPIVTFNLPATSAWFFTSTEIVTIGTLHVLKQEFGWVFLFAASIAQVEGIIGTIYLAKQLRRVRPEYRSYLVVLFISQFFAFAAIWIEIFGLNPFAPVSIFYLSFIPTCIAVSWAIFGLRVGRALPLMREKVVETMHDSVIVIDGRNRVAYLNPAARQAFALLQGQSVGNPLEEVVPELASHLAERKNIGIGPDIVAIRDMVYSSSLSVIEDWKGDTAGQVLVLRNETDRDRLEQTLQTRAAELARSGAFTQALSQVAAKMAASTDLNQVFQTTRSELHRMKIDFMVAVNKPGQSSFGIEYLSLASSLLRQLERLTGMAVKGFEIPGYGELIRLDGIRRGRAIYFPQIVQAVQKMVSKLSGIFEQPIMAAVGINSETAGFLFPLTAQNEEMGIFAVWGPSLCLDDFSALSSFAAQVSAAVQKARLIDSERLRVEELEKANGIITSLAQVAARFEANLKLEEIMEVLGTELKNIGATCLVASIDPQTDELVGRYTSVAPAIWQLAESITKVTMDAFRFPFKDWRALDPNAAGPASIIEDPFEVASKVIRGVPKAILKKSLRIVGITPETPPVWLPLQTSGGTIGILVIWGISFPQQFLSAFSLFGRHVATAIEKARLIADLETMKSFNEGIVQGVAEAIVMIDSDGRVTFANPATSRLIGVPAQELVGHEWVDYIPADRRQEVIATFAHLTDHNETGHEISVLHRNGKTIPVLVSIQPRIKEGHFESALISLMDIEQRVIAEQLLRSSNQEKEALLKEIHHRVKNNLQIISSLISLQSNLLDDPRVQEIFRESQNRVRSMALIHEKLYRSDDLANISFDEYIQDLGRSLLQAYKNETNPVQLSIQADPIALDIDTAIPCGLIVNELITNSLKHAFSGESKQSPENAARIEIRLTALLENRVRLCIMDNGPGFPPNFDFLHTSSLGLQLVNSLVRQIEGNLVFRNQSGACVEIEFNV